MTIKVYMRPHPSQAVERPGGIDRVVENYGKYLPEFGVQVVEPKEDTYDLRVGHAGSLGARTDVETNHGLWWTGDMPDTKPNHYKGNVMVIAALRAAKAVTVPSSWVAYNISRGMHILPHIIPHGINWEDWYPSKTPGNYVLWNKGRSADVCDTKPVTELANRHSGRQFITTFCNELLPNVQVVGRLPFPKMKPLVENSLVYLATTKETFGIGTLEAMASGVPVLGFDWGGTADLITHRETGYLVPPGDYDALAEGLEYCITHRKRLGCAAREAVKKYTWQNTCRMVAKVYEKALSPRYKPGITVVIPSYNYGNVVERAVRSALNQTLAPEQVIVVDDGSQDNGLTKKVVGKIDDPRVLYVRQENMGVAHARNHGVALAKTQYVCCLDADDAIAPTYLATLAPALDADPTLGIAYSSLLLIHPQTGAIHDTSWPPQCNFNQQVRGKNQVPTCCLFRKRAWDEMGGQRQRYAPQGCGTEDADGWLRMGSNGWGIRRVTDEKLFLYTMGGRTWDKKAYQKLDWTAWHPWTRDGKHPFASIATPPDSLPSHPVFQVDIPQVSVIIPVGPYHTGVVVDALDSLEAQTIRQWEVIVVNDSGRVLDLSPWPYATLIETPGEKGAGYARNRGIEVSRASHFIPLDADDFLQAHALERFLVAADLHPGYWIYPDMLIYRGNGELEHYRCEDFSPAELWRRSVGPVTCIYEREMWKRVGGFSETSYREDWDFHMRLAKAGICGVRLPEPLFTYRHSTGERRRDGSHRKEIFTIHKLYDRQEIEMACSSCSKKRRIQNMPSRPNAQDAELTPPRNWSTKEEEGWPVLKYTGSNTATLVFRGKSGRRYYAGNNRSHREVRVHPDDYQTMMRFRYFVPAGTEPDERVMTAEPDPKGREAPRPELWPERVEGPIEGPRPEDQGPAEGPLHTLPDLGDMLVSEIKEQKFEGLPLDELIEQEREGKDRVTVIRHLEKLRGRLRESQ